MSVENSYNEKERHEKLLRRVVEYATLPPGDLNSATERELVKSLSYLLEIRDIKPEDDMWNSDDKDYWSSIEQQLEIY